MIINRNDRVQKEQRLHQPGFSQSLPIQTPINRKNTIKEDPTVNPFVCYTCMSPGEMKTNCLTKKSENMRYTVQVIAADSSGTDSGPERKYVHYTGYEQVNEES